MSRDNYPGKILFLNDLSDALDALSVPALP
jgi:hypothetical protein